MAVSLDDLKKHLRIDHAHDDENLTLLLAASEQHVCEVGAQSAEPRSRSVDAAVLLIASALFEENGVKDAHSIMSIERLLAPKRSSLG